jgi:5'(3')-deoxyribonucleotidase
MAQLRIGCDMDGVLADFNNAYRQRLIDITGRTLIPEGFQPPTWYYATDHYGYTKAEDDATWKSITSDPHFWVDLNAYPKAKDFLRELNGHKDADLYFITTRPGLNVKRQSEWWLHPYVTHPTVLIAKNAESKGLIAAGLQLTHFIDDRPENCLAVKVHSPSTEVFLLDYPYNEWWDEDDDAFIPGILRIDSLDYFAEVIRAERTLIA